MLHTSITRKKSERAGELFNRPRRVRRKKIHIVPNTFKVIIINDSFSMVQRGQSTLEDQYWGQSLKVLTPRKKIMRQLAPPMPLAPTVESISFVLKDSLVEPCGTNFSFLENCPSH